MICYAICAPIGRSEAHAILNDTGIVVMENHNLYYYAEQPLLEIQWEALAVLNSSFEGVYLNPKN